MKKSVQYVERNKLKIEWKILERNLIMNKTAMNNVVLTPYNEDTNNELLFECLVSNAVRT